MVRKLSHFLGEFRREAILAPSLIVLETFCELLIPLVMARIIDIGINGDGGLRYVLIAGLIMLVLSILSMLGGVGAARYASIASQGFGRNLRSALFRQVQRFSFADIDRFSSASLITRITNYVSMLQTTVVCLSMRA